MTDINIIFNDDVRVIDYLADLQDREPLKALQRFINYSHQEPICLLHNCPLDGIVLLILYKAPLDLNEVPNKLILYAYDDLVGMCMYFKRWIDNTKEGNEDRKALNDILRLLYTEWTNQQDENTDKSFLA